MAVLLLPVCCRYLERCSLQKLQKVCPEFATSLSTALRLPQTRWKAFHSSMHRGRMDATFTHHWTRSCLHRHPKRIVSASSWWCHMQLMWQSSLALNGWCWRKMRKIHGTVRRMWLRSREPVQELQYVLHMKARRTATAHCLNTPLNLPHLIFDLQLYNICFCGQCRQAS